MGSEAQSWRRGAAVWCGVALGEQLGMYKLTQQSGRQERCSSTEYVIGARGNGKSGLIWVVDKGVAGCRPVR